MLNRRRFLRGAGGALVAAPFLSSLAEQDAKAAGTTMTTPKRLIVFFTHNGCLTTRWFPKLSHGSLSKDDYTALPTLKPMAPYASKLLMVRGIRAMNEWSFEGTLGQKNEPHTQVSSFFTCHPLNPNSAGGVGAAGMFDGKPTGRSLDHIAAEQVNTGITTPLFMQMGGVVGNTSNNMSVISWDQSEHIFPGYGKPIDVFKSLTQLGAQSTADTYKLNSGKSIIDIVREDLQELQRKKMSSADQRKLSDWAALLHQTGQGIMRVCGAEAPAKLGLTEASVMAGSGLGSKLDWPLTVPLFADLAVLSALCDIHRVIFMKMPQLFNASFLGVNIDATSLSHRIGNAGMGGKCLPDAIEMIAKVDAFYAQQFAYLVGRLDSFGEGDRTLLDNSATVWFQDMSDGNSHNLNNLPILQAGSCGGYFKTGCAVNVEGGKPDLTQGNSEADCLGASPGQTVKDLNQAGTPADVATMPINKYFCNLLNAIGAKAGADGYPVKGGTQEVSRFGKYDDTTLFGKDAPAQIKNPGEYKELRGT